MLPPAKKRKTPGKLLTLISAVFVVAAGCAQTQKVATETNANQTIVSATPPFQTREPERYRATRTITTISSTGEKIVTTNSIARDGELRRDETQLATDHVVYLYLPEGKFLLVPDEKVFVDLTKVDSANSSVDDAESSPDRLLHTDPIATTYQHVGAETVNGRTAQKYRVVVNSSADPGVSGNETLIWIDEALHMPIKSETVSAGGKRVTMELTDIALEAEPVLFRVPAEYQKIDFTELRKRWKNTE
jgi:outer membrane lipoprotein-sorting protein